MESSGPIRLPVGYRADPDQALTDVVAAIELVAGGGATRVVLVGLADPELVVARALARAQCLGVRFALDRPPGGGVAVVIGPIEE